MTDIKYQHARIKWLDSSIVADGWVLPEDIKDFCSTEIQTVGYIVHQNENRYLIAQSLGKNHIQGVISIPACSVVEIKLS